MMISLKQKVIDIYLAHFGKPERWMVAQLIKEKIKKRYIQQILKKIKDEGVLKLTGPKNKPGPKPIDFYKKQKRRLRGLVDGKVAPSLRSLADKFSHDRKVIKRNLAEMNIQLRLRTQRPKVGPGQAERQVERLNRALHPTNGSLRPIPGHSIVMDDESYFTLTRHSTAHCYYKGKREVRDGVKYTMKEKFERKLWCG